MLAVSLLAQNMSKGDRMSNTLSRMEKSYLVLCTSFTLIAVFSNIISIKLVTLPYLNIQIPAGLLIYPLTFLLSDLVTEIFGVAKAKWMVYVALGMNIFSIGILELALWLPTSNEEHQKAFQIVLGLGTLRIVSSLISYIIAQIVDIQVYASIKKRTGSRYLWLRNNLSTCISQMIDTILIDILYLYWGLGMAFQDVLPIMVFSYLYKAVFSFLLTPLLYSGVSFLQNGTPLFLRIRTQKS